MSNFFFITITQSLMLENAISAAYFINFSLYALIGIPLDSANIIVSRISEDSNIFGTGINPSLRSYLPHSIYSFKILFTRPFKEISF